MASTEETVTYHVTLTVTLLEMLGFLVNHEKSQLNPTQSMEFLGFRINSVTLNISLPLGKINSIRRESQKVLENPDITIRELARLLGKLRASIQAVFHPSIGLRQHVSQPTHVHGHTLDLIITRWSDQIIQDSPKTDISYLTMHHFFASYFKINQLSQLRSLTGGSNQWTWIHSKPT